MREEAWKTITIKDKKKMEADENEEGSHRKKFQVGNDGEKK